ncbi:3795_t:CDS:2, partial [Racocetra fulgida]
MAMDYFFWLVFSQDIAVTRAFQDIKLSWWISNVNSYESHYPHLSHNKAITDEFSMIRKSNDFVELKTINCNKVDIIKKNIITDDVTDIINVDTNNDTNSNIINNIVNRNSINNNFNNNNSTNNRVINNNNNGLVVQPSPLEWLRYMVLIKLFSVPRFSSRLISPKLISPANSFDNNQKNDSKRDSKQDITLNNQNNDGHLIHPDPVHLKDPSSLDSLTNNLNQLSLSDPLIGSSKINHTNQTNTSNTNNIHDPFNSTTNEIHISISMVDDDERQIDVMPANDESINSAVDLSQELES